MKRWIRRLVAAIAVPAAGAAIWIEADRLGYDAQPFLADLSALEDSTAAGYANLEWQVHQGVVNPVALHQRTDSLIRAARSSGEARAALVSFGQAFKDGHYHLRRPPSALLQRITSTFTGQRSDAPESTVSASSGCKSLGYRAERSSSLLRKHAAYREVTTPNDDFEGGVIVQGDRHIGVVRIGSFGIHGFRNACEAAWPSATKADSNGVCASRCQTALYYAVSDSILSALRHTITAVTRAGATQMLVDLSGNGGGTDWVTPAARQFTAAKLSGHVAGAIRHPHYHQRMTDAVEDLRNDIATTTDTVWRRTLSDALARAELQLTDIRTPCDRRTVWRNGIASLTCSQLATRTYTTGLLDYLPTSVYGLAGAKTVFSPARFRYAEGVWNGPLTILVDRHTASASEDFVVALKDHGVARVIGEKTYGAGCGYTDGGIGFQLAHSRLRVSMPDCARIRRSGQNEVSGVEVDVAVALDADAVVRTLVKM